jgi:deoxycytidylate deaminase
MIKHAMQYAEFLANKSYDAKMKVGCAIFDGSSAEVVGQGFNGNPEPLNQERDSMEPGKSGYLHAEVRAALSCSKSSVKKECYVTLPPCENCAKVLIELGNVHQVYYKADVNYSLKGVEVLRKAGIEVIAV